MACLTGMGTVEFGTVLVGTFRAEDGVTLDDASVARVTCTLDTDTIESLVEGDVKKFGGLQATILVDDAGIDFSAIVGTTEELVYTDVYGSTYTGDAVLESAPLAGAMDNPLLRTATFFWKQGYVFAVAP